MRIDRSSSLNRKLTLACYLVGLYELAGSLMVAAPDANWYWPCLKATSTAYLLMAPVIISALLDFAGIRRKWHNILVAPCLALTLIQLAQVWTGTWMIAGYDSTRWGTVYEITKEPLPIAVNYIYSIVNTVTGFAALGHAWFHSHSRRYRTIVAEVFIMSLLCNLWGGFAKVVVLLKYHQPDPTCLGAGIVLIGYTYLIERYRHLSERRPDMTGPLLASLKGIALFVDTRGTVIKATQEAIQLLGDRFEDRPLTEVLKGWPGLDDQWAGMKADLLPRTELAGTIGSGRFQIHLFPHRNPFDEFDGALVRIFSEGTLDKSLTAYGLSAREQEVARLVCEGYSTKQIAETLFISLSTVKNHLHNLYAKTETSGKADLVRAFLSEAPADSVED